MTAFLRSHALAVCLGLAFAITGLLGIYLISEEAMPFGDGQHYASRAFALYGYLHTGQWMNFGNLFTSPKEALAPLHYWLFFLVPKPLACVATYMAIQLLSTYLLLAFGVSKLCRILERPEWGPSLFLLCATQTLTLDYAYAFLMDMPFFALGVLTFAWQIQAWRTCSLRNSMLSGLGIGLLFWVKPANALIFLATYLLAEFIRIGIMLNNAQSQEARKELFRSFPIYAKGISIGFFPTFFLALACGAGQTILQLISANEVNATATHLECTGLLRLLYFPLCLTFFYHATALIIIFGIGIITISWALKSSDNTPNSNFPSHLLIPIGAAYLILGEFYSFIMLVKTMRSLLLVLPVLWLVFFWCAEKCRIRSVALFISASCYALFAFTHILFGVLDSSSSQTEGYQLQDSWLAQMPQSWVQCHVRFTLNKEITDSLTQFLPNGGAISLNTTKIYLNNKCVFWELEHERLLRGKPPLNQIYPLFTSDNKVFFGGLINSNALVLITCPNFQTNEVTWHHTLTLLHYSADQWRQKDQMAKIVLLPLNPNMPLGYEIIFNNPLTKSQVKEALDALPDLEVSHDAHDPETNEHCGNKYTWSEALVLLQAWSLKRWE